MKLFLDTFLEYALPPKEHSSSMGSVAPDDTFFSGFVFKVRPGIPSSQDSCFRYITSSQDSGFKGSTWNPAQRCLALGAVRGCLPSCRIEQCKGGGTSSLALHLYLAVCALAVASEHGPKAQRQGGLRPSLLRYAPHGPATLCRHHSPQSPYAPPLPAPLPRRPGKE